MILSIQIPQGAHVKIKAGDKVDFDSPLFEIPSSAEHTLSFTQKLGIEPSKIFHYLKKFVGEDVKKGDVIALKKGVLSAKIVTSEYEGKIKEIDHNEGNIVITTKGKKDLLFSSIKGEIAEIKNKEIHIEVKEGKEFELKKSASNFGGKTVYVKDPSVLLSSNNVAGRILIAESVSSYNQSKMDALGIIGYVTLMKLPEETDLPSVQLKTVQGLNDILKHEYPYCYVDSQSGKIVFYQ